MHVCVLGPRRDRCFSDDRLTVYAAIVADGRPADVHGQSSWP